VKLIVGLGNPGPEYAGTRHNAGFEVIDRVARRWGVSMGTEKFHGWFGMGEIRGTTTALLKPMTYMNRSGQAVLAAGRFYKLELPDLLVISDDLALPLGRLRMRESGSSGGHNGLQDIVDRLGSDTWCRLRVGVGSPAYDATSHVLSRFEPGEEALVARAAETAADAVECWIEHGPGLTMTRFNGDVPPE
jgi:PTH1 family peptidyl-tRNA hydrolase